MTDSKRVAIVLALVPFVALGLARFAYGLLLPPMRDDLGWSYGLAGTVTTANAAGYLAGALLAPSVVRRFGERGAVVGGVALTALLLALNGVTGMYALIIVTRFGAGLSGGVAFVAGGVLAARLSRRGAPNALIWYTSGAGAGIAASALAIPPLVDANDQWPLGWYLLAGLTAACALALGAVVPREDEDVDTATTPAGRGVRLGRAETAYGLFGLGYIAYITFAVAYLRDGGASSNAVITFWFILGMAGFLATPIWSRILPSIPGNIGLGVALAGCATGVALLAVSRAWPASTVSAMLLGGSLLGVVSAVTGLARDVVAEHDLPGTIARLTVVFGAGQTLGPILAGLIGDTSAGLRLGLVCSAVMLATGALVSASGQPQTVAS